MRDCDIPFSRAMFRVRFLNNSRLVKNVAKHGSMQKEGAAAPQARILGVTHREPLM